MIGMLHQQQSGSNCPTKFKWLKLVLLSSSLGLMACQSTPQQKIVTQNVKPLKTATVPSAQNSAYKPLLVNSNAVNGLTDLKWELISINSKNPQPFINQPYLYLQSPAHAVSGSTGCNALTGTYSTTDPKAIKIQALAGHMVCNDALAQEAEIMDVLGRVNSYQLQQNMLYLYDRNGALLLTARAGR